MCCRKLKTYCLFAVEIDSVIFSLHVCSIELKLYVLKNLDWFGWWTIEEHQCWILLSMKKKIVKKTKWIYWFRTTKIIGIGIKMLYIKIRVNLDKFESKAIATSLPMKFSHNHLWQFNFMANSSNFIRILIYLSRFLLG